MGVARAGWTILETTFRCRAAPPELLADLEALLRGFPRPRAGANRAVDFEIGGGADAADLRLLDGPGRGRTCGLSRPVAAAAEYVLVREAVERAGGRFVLHAAAVVAPAGTCLIAGGSGIGKTSLALRLWRWGMRLLSDDLVPIPYGALAPEVFPRAAHLDAPLPAVLRAQLPAPPPSYPAGHYPFPEPAGGAVPPVAVVLFPERTDVPSGELLPLNAAEATQRLLRSAIRTAHFRFDDVLSSLIALAARSSAYRLRAGSPEAAFATALRVLGE